MDIDARAAYEVPLREEGAMTGAPNKHMLRAGTHKVLGRGRSGVVLRQVPLARVLIRWRAGADVNR